MVPTGGHGCGRLRPLAIAFALALAGMLAIAGRSGGAAAEPGRFERSALPLELSAARRFGGRRLFAGARPRKWIAHRNAAWRRHARWDRDDRDRDGKDNTRPADERPHDPGRAPDHGWKPGAGDHVGKRDDRGGEPRGPVPESIRDRDRDLRPLPPVIATPEPVSHLVCIGGHVRDGRCGCAHDQLRLSAGRSIFRCLDRTTLAGLTGAPAGGFDPPGPRPPGAPPQSPGQSPAVATPEPFVPDEILVTVARTLPDSVDDAVRQRHGLQLLARSAIQLIDRRVLRYRIANGRPLEAALAALRADARIADPQPNFLYRYLQDGSAESRTAGLQYALAKIDAWRAQALARGRGVRVAVIDSGIDATHPDLASAIVDRFDAAG